MSLESRPKARWMRRLPLALLVALAGAAWLTWGDALNFQTLARHQQALLAFRDAHYLWASLGFIALYVLVVVTSLPGALILTLTGGFLFGLFPGAAYNLVGATIGAVLIFLAARAGIGRDVAQGIAARGGQGARLMAGLRENEFLVLLTMRLIPVIPFFLANLLPAFVGVRLAPFALTTALGILPADVIYTSIGAGLGEVLARGEVPELGLLTEPRFALPLLGLAALSALPLVVKWARRR